MKTPLVKENRLAMLIKDMECINKYAFNRESQMECILKLYPDKSEKSVFRGMVIPTLRHLGFIVGYSDLIRLSANGKLVLESKQKGDKEFKRVSQAVFLEIDRNNFKFVEDIKNLMSKNTEFRQDILIQVISQKIEAPSAKQKEERIVKWLKILEQCNLIKKEKNKIHLLYNNLRQTEKDLNWREKSTIFREFLFEAYSTLSINTAGIVDIVDLRENVALAMYNDIKAVLTEAQFDKLLSHFPLVTDEYIISLGHPMGAEEKLFVYQRDYYRTLNINFLRRGYKYG